MVFGMESERRYYGEVLEHEVKMVVRMLRAFPAERFAERHPVCAHSARDLAADFVAHIRGIEELVYGRVVPREAAASRTRGGLLLELETAAMGAYAALVTLPAARWGDVLEVPFGFAPCRQARRGELLWLALEETMRHTRHFARHAKGTRGEVSGVPERDGRESIDHFAIGA